MGAVYWSPSIYSTSEENYEKSQLNDSLMNAVRPVISSNGVPYIQINLSSVLEVRDPSEDWEKFNSKKHKY